MAPRVVPLSSFAPLGMGFLWSLWSPCWGLLGSPVALGLLLAALWLLGRCCWAVVSGPWAFPFVQVSFSMPGCPTSGRRFVMALECLWYCILLWWCSVLFPYARAHALPALPWVFLCCVGSSGAPFGLFWPPGLGLPLAPVVSLSGAPWLSCCFGSPVGRSVAPGAFLLGSGGLVVSGPQLS